MNDHARTACTLLLGVLLGACLASLLHTPQLISTPKAFLGSMIQGAAMLPAARLSKNATEPPPAQQQRGSSLAAQANSTQLAELTSLLAKNILLLSASSNRTQMQWINPEAQEFGAAAAVAAAVASPQQQLLNNATSAVSAKVVPKQPPPRLEVIIGKEDFWLDTHFKAAFLTVPNCTLQGQPLHCEYVSVFRGKGNKTAQALLSRAEAVLHPRRWNVSQLSPANLQKVPQVWLNMESYLTTHDVYSSHSGEIEMTYQTCSQVHFPYLHFYGGTSVGPFPTAQQKLQLLQAPVVPFKEKHNAIFWASSNCFPRNNRVLRVMELQKALANSSLALHSYGRCLKNMNKTLGGHTGESDKTRVSSQYKFCIAMENTNTRDYVTEKVYDALLAGCLPIYWGAPNVGSYIPQKDAILDLDNFSNSAALVAELERLASNETAYNERLAWKKQKMEQLNPAFVSLVKSQHPYCSLCQLVAEQRQQPHRTFTKCRDNSTFWKLDKSSV